MRSPRCWLRARIERGSFTLESAPPGAQVACVDLAYPLGLFLSLGVCVRTLARVGPIFIVVVALLVGFVRAAAAQHDESSPAGDRAQEPSGYRAVIDEALAEYQAQHYEEARALFEEAHAMFPSARTLRGLGISEFELRHYAAAVRYLEGALEAKIRPLDARLRADTTALLMRTYRFVGRIEVEREPSSARVLVDEQETSVTDSGPVVLDLGEHRIQVDHPGYEPQQRVWTIRGREQERWRVVLQREGASVRGPRAEAGATNDAARGAFAPGTTRADAPQLRRRKLWIWAAAGLAVVGAGVAAGLLLRPSPHDQVGTPTHTANSVGIYQVLQSAAP